MRRVLNQLAWAAVRTKGQLLFPRSVPPPSGEEGTKVAIWAVAHLLLRPIWKVLHQKVRYIEHGLQEWQSASHSEA